MSDEQIIKIIQAPPQPHHKHVYPFRSWSRPHGSHILFALREAGYDVVPAAEIERLRALADALAAFIDKPVRVHPVATDEVATYSVAFQEDWKAERLALLARYREARQ